MRANLKPGGTFASVWVAAVFVLAAIVLAVASQAVRGEATGADADVTFETDTLTIQTARGERHAFTVELAVTPVQRARGLMHRKALAADHGMLFVYPRVDDVAMWMKNTLIPLDMLFIDARGKVVRIAERTEPHSLEPIDSGEPVLAVLELLGGTADRLGLAPGDRVRHGAFADEGGAD